MYSRYNIIDLLKAGLVSSCKPSSVMMYMVVEPIPEAFAAGFLVFTSILYYSHTRINCGLRPWHRKITGTSELEMLLYLKQHPSEDVEQVCNHTVSYCEVTLVHQDGDKTAIRWSQSAFSIKLVSSLDGAGWWYLQNEMLLYSNITRKQPAANQV